MKDKQIIFNSDMVRALLNGRKTQNRRMCKLQPHINGELTWWPDGQGTDTASRENAPGCYLDLCPFGQMGDLLWVRETWQHSNYPLGPLDPDCDIHFRSDYFNDPHGMDGEKSPKGKYRKWKSSSNMPRWASRITLKITDVRVERLMDISEEDAIAEGAQHFDDIPIGSSFSANNRWLIGNPENTDQCLSSAKWAFANYWCRENGNSKSGIHDQRPWDSNPWVWVIEFEVIKKNIDDLIGEVGG